MENTAHNSPLAKNHPGCAQCAAEKRGGYFGPAKNAPFVPMVPMNDTKPYEEPHLESGGGIYSQHQEI